MKNIRFTHVNIVSRSYKELAEFYINVFGCTEVLPTRNLRGGWVDDLTNIKDVHIKGIHLLLPGSKEGGPTLEIFEYNKNIDSLSAINKVGFGHIAFSVDDVSLCLTKVIDHGGSVVGKHVEADVEGVGLISVVYAKDPEGNIIEIQKWGD
ncbi:MAG: VOC family protein [Sphaerochaetaceae bacterium]|jgi:lactoylglutathione lyase